MASCQELADTDVARAGDFSSRGKASARSAARCRTNAADDAPRGGCEAKVSQHQKDCPALVGASSSLTYLSRAHLRRGEDDAWLFDS